MRPLADLSKCTRDVPFTNVWIQKTADIAVANDAVCNMIRLN